jgi:dTDP-4-amino-4,6-dideoxygalactose transaminase
MAVIPFNRPAIGPRAVEYVNDVLQNGHHSGDGIYTKRATEALSSLHNSARVLLTTSCTHALEMAALLINLEPGDEVIMPSFTFVSTANAFVLRGAHIVWGDIDRRTLSLDVDVVEALITPRTRAVVVVHYAGVSPDMERLVAVCRSAGVTLIEDNAHGLFGAFRNRPLGTFGDLSTLSFHETKNVSCGEGGALAINNDMYSHRAEILREKGTNRSQFFRGAVDKYTWMDVGSSYLPADMNAAVLLAAIEDRERTQQRRHSICEQYRSELADWSHSVAGQLSAPIEDRSLPDHLFRVIFDDPANQHLFIDHMRRRDITSVFHYVPLHSSPFGSRFELRLPCTNTDWVASRLVRLPLFADLSDRDLERVVDVARSFDPIATAGSRAVRSAEGRAL